MWGRHDHLFRVARSRFIVPISFWAKDSGRRRRGATIIAFGRSLSAFRFAFAALVKATVPEGLPTRSLWLPWHARIDLSKIVIQADVNGFSPGVPFQEELLVPSMIPEPAVNVPVIVYFVSRFPGDFRLWIVALGNVVKPSKKGGTFEGCLW